MPGRRPPAVLGADDLVAAHYLLSRTDRHGIARTPFPDRVAAAAHAGFAGIGVQPHDYERSVAEGLTDEARLACLERHGVALAEIDGVAWFGAAHDAAARAARERVLRVADRFGVRLLNAPMPSLPDAPDAVGPTDDDLAADLADLADRAAELGAIVGFEFLPWTPVRDVLHATRIVQTAGRANLGVTVDVWHHSVSGVTLEQLGTVPGDAVVSVHVTDGVRDPSLTPLAETTVGRRLPGEGELPVAAVLRRLDEIGVRVPCTVEIVSLPHRHLPLEEWAVLAATSVRGALAAARSAPAS